MTTTAKLIFSGNQTIALPHLAGLLSGKNADWQTTDAGLTSLTLARGGLCLDLETAFIGEETHVILSMRTDRAATDLQVELAPVLYHLAATLPATEVVWGDTAVRIPRATFVAGLADSFGPVPTSATVTPIAPRRVEAPRRKAARPAPKLAALLPAPGALPRPTLANDNASLGDTRADAHVQAYEAHIRATLLRAACADELQAIRDETGVLPIEARLSTWAVSLTVATVALPVAVPVMAYNLAKGEDLRAASLALGLAGFLLAMDTSGALAGMVGML